MYKDTEDFCLNCLECQLVNTACLNFKDELHPVGVPKKVMSQIGIDIAAMPEVDGLKYYVAAVDYFTKYVEAKAIPDKTAKTVAQFVFEDIICRHSCPDVIISDQGREFNNALLDELCLPSGSSRRVTSPYCPSANGMIERINLIIKSGTLKTSQEEAVFSWPRTLPGVVFA